MHFADRHKNLDVIYSNDPDELLPTAMLHAADGRLRLRNILQHPFFNRYDVIIVDSKGATGVMTELSLLSSTGNVMGVVKPILPDVREFIRGSLHMLTRLKTYENYGIRLPDISILVNCIENTLLDREAMDGLAAIINENITTPLRWATVTFIVYSIPVSRRWIFSNWGTSSSSPCIVWNTKHAAKVRPQPSPCTTSRLNCSPSGRAISVTF